MRIQDLSSEAVREEDQLLTTGQAALILGTSRQHVADLCDRGDLPFATTGTHRRVRRGDVESLRLRTQRLTRDQRRSLWLGHAIAGKLALDPTSVLGVAMRNLTQLRRIHGRGAARRWIDEWERLLERPLEDVLEALTSRTPRARELRQNSPFAGVLSEEERTRVLSGFGPARSRAK